MLEKYANEAVEETWQRLQADMKKHRRMGYLTPLVSVDYHFYNLQELEKEGKIKMTAVEQETCDYPFSVYGVEIVE